MSESDNPQGIGSSEPLSMAEAISAYASQKPETEPGEGQPEQDEDEAAGETSPDGEEDQNAETDEDAEEEGQSDEDDDEQPDEPAAERFAPEDAKVKLADGTTVTVAELIAGNLKDRDYRQKTEAVSQERKALEQEKSQAQQHARYLQENLQWMNSFAASLEPKAPDPAMVETDPVGYMQAKAIFDTQIQHWNHLKALGQHEAARVQEEQRKELTKVQRAEAVRLLEIMPELKDGKKYETFLTGSVDTMSKHYGFSAEEIGTAMDHRLYPVFRDLMDYHRIKARAGKVVKDVENRPPVLKSGKRSTREAQSAQARKAASDRLTKTGSLKDGIALLLQSEKGA